MGTRLTKFNMAMAGRTFFITGASRGIGLAIGLAAARQGANVVVAAKTVKAQEKLEGTIYSAASAIEEAGGKAMPVQVDIRSEDQVEDAMAHAAGVFGGIDVVVNNASALGLTGTSETEMKRFDLMHGINARGTFVTSKAGLKYLLKSDNNPHVLNISPPLNMDPKWFAPHTAYTMAKYGMSMCTLGMAEEFKGKVAFNALWPRTTIATAAIKNLLGGNEVMARSRKPEIMADAAALIVQQDAQEFTGNFLIDDDVLKDLGGLGDADLDQYLVDPANKDNLAPDFFL